jgi:hypothetical protein
MDQGGWLQRVALAFLPQVLDSKPTKFFVDERHEVIEGLFIAVRPLGQQLRHIVRGRHGLHIENVELEAWRHCTPLSFASGLNHAK